MASFVRCQASGTPFRKTIFFHISDRRRPNAIRRSPHRFHGAMSVHPIGLGFQHSNQRRRQMQASNVCTPTIDHFGTILVAIELSRQSWLVTMHSPDRDRISRHKLCGGDDAGLMALIERVQERAARALGSVPAVVSCYEAGYGGFW